uniref:Uncharacterized protein n=1 Tax=Arundo donax TaxID=35708 RepID=A0A0A9EKE9_ARUDO
MSAHPRSGVEKSGPKRARILVHQHL